MNPDFSFYEILVGEIAVSEQFQTALTASLKLAFDDPKSYYDESDDFVLSERGLTWSGHSKLTAKFVLVDKMIEARQMMEIDWKESEKDARHWIMVVAKAKNYDLSISYERKYSGDTFENLLSINDRELEPAGYCLEILNIDSDSYVFTILPLNKKQVVREMFDKLG